MNIGEVIRTLRKKRAISQEHLASQLKITQGFLSLVETGEREPGLDLIDKIAKALCIPKELVFLLSCKYESHSKKVTKHLKKITTVTDDLLAEIFKSRHC